MLTDLYMYMYELLSQPQPPLNLKGPSDLSPGPKKPYKAPPGLLLIWSVAMSWHFFIGTTANQFFTNTFIILSFAAVKHPWMVFYLALIISSQFSVVYKNSH
jgi:hypothetical protein